VSVRGGYFAVRPASILHHPKFLALSLDELGAWLKVRALQELLNAPMSLDAVLHVGVLDVHVDQLIAQRLLDVLEDGTLQIHDIEDHSGKSPSDAPERVRERVQRHRAAPVTDVTTPVTTCNDPVTTPVTTCNDPVTDVTTCNDPVTDVTTPRHATPRHATPLHAITTPTPVESLKPREFANANPAMRPAPRTLPRETGQPGHWPSFEEAMSAKGDDLVSMVQGIAP
jgi:hypothetical protein